MRSIYTLLLISMATALPVVALAQTTTIVEQPPVQINPPLSPTQPQLQISPEQWKQFEPYLTRPIFHRSWENLGHQVPLQEPAHSITHRVIVPPPPIPPGLQSQ